MIATGLGCSGMTRLFFSDDPDDIEAAKAICAGCGRVVRCCYNALTRGEEHGVWGGFSAAERAEIVDAIRDRGGNADQLTAIAGQLGETSGRPTPKSPDSRTRGHS